MSICQVVNDIDLFFTRPYDLTPEMPKRINKNKKHLRMNCKCHKLFKLYYPI